MCLHSEESADDGFEEEHIEEEEEVTYKIGELLVPSNIHILI